MPHDTPVLTRFVRRDTTDKLMFGFVQGVQAALPSVGVEKALELFRSAMQIPAPDWNVKSQRIRYQRILTEYFEDKRTKRPHGEEEQARQ